MKVPRVFLSLFTPQVKSKVGTVVNEASRCIDFMPLVVNLMNAKHGQMVDGRDPTAIFTGSKLIGVMWLLSVPPV